MNELLCLKWNNHSSTLLKKIKAIYSKDIFCDVTIACHGRYYPAHKLVLSVCSEYFEEIFQQTQCKHPFLILKDIKPSELEALLSYMYNGEVNVPQVALQGLIKAAESLKIKGLAVTDDPEENVDKPKSKKRKLEHSNSITQELSNGEKNKASPETLNSLNQDETDMFNIKREPLESDNVMEERIDEVNLVTHDEYETSQSLENSRLNPHVQSPTHQPLKEEQILDSEAVAQCSSWDETWRDSNHDRSQEEIAVAGSMRRKDTASLASNVSDSSFPIPLYFEQQSPNLLSNNIPFHGCPFCSFRTKRAQCLQIHIQRKHSIGRPFTCSWCDYSCTSSATLKTHSMRHNSNSKKHKCPHCSYETFHSIDMKRHLMCHTGEKPYACSYCSYKSTKGSILKAHIEKYHSVVT